MTTDVVVIGIGQTLRGDDAAGLAAVQLWQQTYPRFAKQQKLRVELAELPGMRLLSLLEGARVAILVDAVHTNSKPGTVHIFSEDDLASAERESPSAHGWGVVETLALGRILTPQLMPDNIVLIGIEAAEFGMGQTLSPLVTAALPTVASQIEQSIYRAIS